MNEIFSAMSDHFLLDTNIPKSVKLHVISPHILDQASRRKVKSVRKLMY